MSAARFISVLFALSFMSPSFGQATPAPTPTQPLPAGGMARATLQIRGAKESELPVLLSRQLAAGWSTTLGLWDSLWIGTNGKGNVKIWPMTIPAVPSSLPPTGPAGGRLAGQYPNPSLAASGVSPGVYGTELRYPAFTVSADGTLSTVLTYPLPVIPATLPPSGAASGDLTGTYPAPTLAAITTAKTVGGATQIPVVTVDAKGRVTNLTTVTAADPFTQKIRTARLAMPSLLGAAVSDVTLTWATPFADANYTASVTILQSGGLSGIATTYSLTAQTATGVTIRVKNVGLVSMAPVVHAIAIHD